MQRPVRRYTQTTRGAIPVALQVVLVIMLLIGATAAGLFWVGPWLTSVSGGARSADTNTAAEVDDGSRIARDGAGGNTPANEPANPRMVSNDNALASIRIGEQPKPSGDIIRRTETPPGEADPGGVTPEAPVDESGDPVAPVKSGATKPDTRKQTPTNPTTDGTTAVRDTGKTKPPTPEVVTPTAPSGPLFRVRVGICSDRTTAEEMLGQLKSKGYKETSIVTYTKGGRTFYGVQTGAFGKKENADAVRAKLRNDGWDSTVIPDESH